MHDKPIPHTSPLQSHCFMLHFYYAFSSSSSPSLSLPACLSVNLFVSHTAFSLVYSFFSVVDHPIMRRWVWYQIRSHRHPWLVQEAKIRYFLMGGAYSLLCHSQWDYSITGIYRIMIGVLNISINKAKT